MRTHENPHVLRLLGLDRAVDAADEEHVEQMLDHEEDRRDDLDDEALLHAQMVQEEREAEVLDTVDFLEQSREMVWGDDV